MEPELVNRRTWLVGTVAFVAGLLAGVTITSAELRAYRRAAKEIDDER